MLKADHDCLSVTQECVCAAPDLGFLVTCTAPLCPPSLCSASSVALRAEDIFVSCQVVTQETFEPKRGVHEDDSCAC